MRDPCVYCGAPAEGLDHITPRSVGGSDSWENRAPACAACDGEKAAYALIGFLLGEKIARHRVTRRRYMDAQTRKQAIAQIREHIAKQFYSGNIRWAS